MMDPQATNNLPEHDYEPLPGLPEALPPGEFIRWQGQPDWRDLARSVFHVRKLAVYFLVLLAIRLGFQVQEGAELAGAVQAALGLALLAVVAIGLLTLMAWLMARATSYTITNKRLVIRSGVAVSLAVNLPFSRVESVDFRQRANGFGDLPVLFDADTKPSWIILWPHVRPWSFGRVQPMLRSLPDAARVAELLSTALREHALEDGAQVQPPRLRERRTVISAVQHPSAG